MKDWNQFLEEAKKHIPKSIDCEIKMISSINSLTRFANSHIHQNVEEEVADIYLTVHKDDKTITLNSNITSIDSPKSLIDKALAEVENSPNDTGWAGMPESDSSFNGYKEIEPKNPEERAGKVKDFIEVGKDFNAAGYCSTSVDHYFVWNTNGLESSDSTTSAFIDGIFRTETSSGSSHRGGTSLEDIDSETAGIEAFKLAKDSQNPKDIDPGKYEVVLGPEAVSTILVFLGVYGFNARSKIEGTSPIQMNSQQFDEKLTLIDDPHRDKSLGFKIDASGAPKKTLEIVKDGVPKSLFHTRRTAKELNEDTGFNVSIKSLIAIGFAMATIIGMWFALQADIAEAKELPAPPDPEVTRMEFDMKDQMIRNTIMTTQKDVEEIKVTLEKIEDNLYNR